MLTIPNGQTLATTKTMCLQLTNLLQLATTAYFVPNIHNNCWQSQSCAILVVRSPLKKMAWLSSPVELLPYEGGETYQAICGMYR